MNQDTRANNVFRFPRRGPGANRVLLRHGAPDAPLNKTTGALAELVVGFHRQEDDLRASTNMTKSELDARRTAAQTAFAKALEPLAAEVVAARRDLALQMLVSPVRPGRELDFYQATLDRELREQFRALKHTDRAIAVHQMTLEPMQHLSMVEALLRAPRELTGLAHDEATALRVRTLAALKPGEFKALDDALNQLNTAAEAITEAALTLSATGVAHTTVLADAPTAVAVMNDSAAELNWLPPTVDARYAPGQEADDE
jgi:hypothetical protein